MVAYIRSVGARLLGKLEGDVADLLQCWGVHDQFIGCLSNLEGCSLEPGIFIQRVSWDWQTVRETRFP